MLSVREALPLFTAISTNPLDPTYATASPAFPLAKVGTMRETACVPTCKFTSPFVNALSGKSSTRKFVIKFPNASTRITIPFTTPSLSFGFGIALVDQGQHAIVRRHKILILCANQQRPSLRPHSGIDHHHVNGAGREVR